MPALTGFLPCPHGDAVCSRSRRDLKRFQDSGLCMDCSIDLAPSLGAEARPPAATPQLRLVARVGGRDVEVSA